MSLSEVWLWRKYEMGVKAVPWTPDCLTGLFFWQREDTKQLPELNRWDGLEKAFAGFVSRDCGSCHATAYYLEPTLGRLLGLLKRDWTTGSDAAEIVEILHANLLGVWFGERTPYIVTTGPELHQEVRKTLENMVW